MPSLPPLLAAQPNHQALYLGLFLSPSSSRASAVGALSPGGGMRCSFVIKGGELELSLLLENAGIGGGVLNKGYAELE